MLTILAPSTRGNARCVSIKLDLFTHIGRIFNVDYVIYMSQDSIVRFDS